MKLVLTEQQFNEIILREALEMSIFESLNESKNINDLKRKIKRAILAGATVAAIIGAIAKISANNEEKKMLKQYAIELAENGRYIDSINKQQQKADSIRNLKIEACRDFMETALNNQGYTMDDTQLTPEALVDTCEKNNFSIPFAMSVVNWESCFGATNRAKRTNSVFSVGAYDDGRDVCTYGSPDESIQPFIDLINNDYLINGKTINDLLKPGCFVNKNGHRYSRSTTYERDVKDKMNKIARMYPVLNS